MLKVLCEIQTYITCRPRLSTQHTNKIDRLVSPAGLQGCTQHHNILLRYLNSVQPVGEDDNNIQYWAVTCTL